MIGLSGETSVSPLPRGLGISSYQFACHFYVYLVDVLAFLVRPV